MQIMKNTSSKASDHTIAIPEAIVKKFKSIKQSHLITHSGRPYKLCLPPDPVKLTVATVDDMTNNFLNENVETMRASFADG